MKIDLIVGARPYYMKAAPVFRERQLPQPQVYLRVGSGWQGEQTGKIMITYEKAVLADKPDLVLVAAKLHIQVGHIEGGLRSRDWRAPEEINRIVTDSIADYLFTTCRDADANLLAEGIAKQKIFFVGNTMIDSLHYYMPKID